MLVPGSALGARASPVRNVAGRSQTRAWTAPTRIAVTSGRAHHTITHARVTQHACTTHAMVSNTTVGTANHGSGVKPIDRDASRKSTPEFAPAASALVLGGLLTSFATGVDQASASDLVSSASATAAESGSLTDGFLSAFLLIFFSEIGDKTFFIAVLLATQQSKSSVFLGTFGALAVMTVISVGIGQVFHVAEETTGALLQSDVPWDDYLAIALLLFFGIQTLLSAEEETAEEEEEDAKIAVAGMEFDGATALILSTFALVFAAEWGDKSFIATIALSAAASPAGVALGGAAGHGVATGIAVLVGDILGNVVSERMVKYTGGALFILFAIATALDIQ